MEWFRRLWWNVGVLVLGASFLLVGLIARVLSPAETASAAWTEDLQVDGDGDGVPDAIERGWYGSDPRKADTDGDGLPDGFEAAGGLSPIERTNGDADPDGDGLSNREELRLGTHPLAADTDGDTVADGAEVAAHTDPRIDPDAARRPRTWLDPIARPAGAPDSDRDGLSDWEELTVSHTDPASPDTDGDLLVDSFEVIGGTNPHVVTSLSADFDLDGLSTEMELRLGTSPTKRDTDGDGKSDLDNIGVWVGDADNDGLNDEFELRGGLASDRWTDPHDDPDADGVPNFVEMLHGTHPMRRDTDGDTLGDGRELAAGDDPRHAQDPAAPVRRRGRPSPLIPRALDSDRDGLSDIAEARAGTDPTKADTDGDLLPDRFEIDGGLDPRVSTDGTADPDADGLGNFDELIHGARPDKADSDGDGARDGDEVTAGGDPADANDRGQPPPPGEIVKLRLTVGDPSSSNSERWNLVVGNVRHQAPVFGEVAAAEYSFVRGRRYRVSVEHAGSSLPTPDYDYEANIVAVDPTIALVIDDPEGVLGNRSDTNPTGHAAWLVIGGAPPPLLVSKSLDETSTLRFVRPTGTGVAPLDGALVIREPYMLEATFGTPQSSPMVATLRWELEDTQQIELRPVPGEPTKLRSARITFTNPIEEVSAALPPSPVGVTSEQLAGRWKIEHVGDVGIVEGVGVVDGTPAGAAIELRFGGRSFFLFSYELVDDEGTIEMKLRGRLPAPKQHSPGAVDQPLGESPGVVVELPQLTERVSAEIADARTDAGIRGPYSDIIEIAGTRVGDRIAATWRRKRGDDVVDHGTQKWTKADPVIDGIIVVEDQTFIGKAGPSYPYPFDNPGVTIPMQGRTLVVHGRNLPINPGDPISVDALEQPLWYFTGSSSMFDKQDLATAWKKLPAGALRGPDAIIVRARIQKGILPGPQPLRLNGMVKYWSLEFGDTTAEIDFVRATSVSERELTETVLVGEHVQIQVETTGRLPMDELELAVARNGEPVSFGEAPLVAKREGGSRSKIYRTPPILLHAAGARDRSAPPQPNEVALEVKGDDRLLAVVHRPELLRVTKPGSVRVLLTPSNVGTLWKDALRRAAICNNTPITDWKTIGRAEVESISNLVVFAWEYRSTKINLGQQAAMILLRDTFVEMLGNVRAEFAQLRASSENVRKFYAYMKQYQYDEKLPFNQMEIALPDGGKRKFPTIYAETIVEQHRNGRSAKQLESWAFAQTKSALDAFIAQMDVALARAGDAGDCEVKDLLEITGVGFEAVVSRLKPRLMQLQSEPPRSYWVPDKVARGTVDGIRSLADAVKAQKELASVDNTMIALSLAAVSIGAGAILGEGLVGLVVSLGLDAADLAFTLATELPELYGSRREIAFATGAQTVVGPDRLDQARANEVGWFSVATSVFGAGLGTAFSAYRALKQADKLAAVRRGASLFDNVRAKGLDSLTEAQRSDFAMYVMNAKARGGALSATEKAALKWVDDAGNAASAKKFAASVIGGDADPALVTRLENAENRRVIERTVDELGNTKLTPQQVDRMLEAHHVGKPPYDRAALRKKLELLTQKPPAGAGLTKDQADALLRKGIMGNARPDPISSLPTAKRTELRSLLNKPDPSGADRKRIADLWLESERGYSGSYRPHGLDAAQNAVAADIAAGRYTPEQFDEVIRALDEIQWDISHNMRNIQSAGPGWAARTESMKRQVEAQIKSLGMSKAAEDAVFARFRQAWKRTADKPPQLFRGENPSGFTPRELDVERTSPTLRTKFQKQPYFNPKGKGNPPSTLAPTGDIEVDHIYPVAMIKQMPGFWRLSPEGRRIVLHFEGNLQGLPKSINNQKRAMLADEWKATGQISGDYHKWLKAREDAMEKRLPQLINCLLRGGTEADCIR